MTTNSLKQHQVMPEMKGFKLPDVLKLCKENASSFTKKCSENTSGIPKPGKVL